MSTNQDYWSVKLQERKTRLSSILNINAPDSMLETECMLVLIALHKGTRNALSQVTDYMTGLIQREQEYNKDQEQFVGTEQEIIVEDSNIILLPRKNTRGN